MTSNPSLNVAPRTRFWQLVVSIEPSPAFLFALEEFEDHRERRPVRQTVVRSDRAIAHSGGNGWRRLM
jgi:hypothetical protein